MDTSDVALSESDSRRRLIKIVERLKTGAHVSVPLGRQPVSATVVERRRGRIEVEIDVQDADPIRTTFAPEDVIVPAPGSVALTDAESLGPFPIHLVGGPHDAERHSVRGLEGLLPSFIRFADGSRYEWTGMGHKVGAHQPTVWGYRYSEEDR